MWGVGGPAVGLLGWKALRPFSSPLLDWYRGRREDPERLRRMYTLVREGKAHTPGFERCLAEEAFGMELALPPLFGLFHGVLFGAVVGALCGLDSGLGISAAAGAAVGMLLGPALVAFVAGATSACLARLDERLPLRVRLARRAMLVLSPLLIAPAVWHCLKRAVKR